MVDKNRNLFMEGVKAARSNAGRRMKEERHAAFQMERPKKSEVTTGIHLAGLQEGTKKSRTKGLPLSRRQKGGVHEERERAREPKGGTKKTLVKKI